MKSRSAVIYCRVSSWSQALGDGLARQLRTCLQHCDDRGLSVHAVFSEVGTDGDGRGLPVRAQAMRVARRSGAAIVVESHDRWSRAQEPVPHPLTLIYACPIARELAGRIQSLLQHHLDPS